MYGNILRWVHFNKKNNESKRIKCAMFTRRFFTRDLSALLSSGKKIGLITSSLPYNGQFFLWLKKQQETILIIFTSNMCKHDLYVWCYWRFWFECRFGLYQVYIPSWGRQSRRRSLTHRICTSNNKKQNAGFQGLNNFRSTNILIYCKISLHWFYTMNRCILERILLRYQLSLDLDHNYRGNYDTLVWNS